MVLRSDELANEAEVDRDQKFRGNVGKGIASAVTLGAGAASGAFASKIMPFLNQYIPTGLAMKGIEKVSPKLGAFLKKGQEMGLKVEDGLNFIKEKVEPAKEKRNIVEQYSPDLHQFIQEQIQKGVSPIQAGAIAQAGIKGKNFESAIKKLVKDHKTDWSSILQTVYGSGTENVRNQPQNGTSPQQTQQQTQQPKQSSSGQQALMDVLNKINQRLGK